MKPLFAAIFLVALTLATKPLLADDASARALAGQLIDMTNGKEVMRNAFDGVINSMISNMQAQGMPQAGVDEIKAAIDKWYDAEIKFDEIRPKMIDIYVQNFSEDDLKQLVAFYNSPVGQKAIKSLPVVMSQSMALTQEYTKSKIPMLTDQISAIVQKYAAQMQGGAGGASGGGTEAPGAGAPPGGDVPAAPPGPPGN